MPQILERPIEIVDDATDQGSGRGEWGVLLFNDETHSMQQVQRLLMQITKCDENEAYMEMWEAHTYGKAFCHFASEEECGKIAWALSSHGLKTQVVKDPALM